MKKVLFVLSIAVLIMSCKKEKVEPIVEEPIEVIDTSTFSLYVTMFNNIGMTWNNSEIIYSLEPYAEDGTQLESISQIYVTPDMFGLTGDFTGDNIYFDTRLELDVLYNFVVYDRNDSILYIYDGDTTLSLGVVNSMALEISKGLKNGEESYVNSRGANSSEWHGLWINPSEFPSPHNTVNQLENKEFKIQIRI